MNNFNIFINSPLSQFEVTNLIGINAPILGNLHLNLTNLSLYSIFVVLTIMILFPDVWFHLKSQLQKYNTPAKGVHEL